MSRKSVINWEPFTKEFLPAERMEMVLLLRSQVERLRPTIYTDLWTGDCLLHLQECRVDYFCPLAEINLPAKDAQHES